MKQSNVRQSLVFLEQLAHMRHGHVRLVFLKLVIFELIRVGQGAGAGWVLASFGLQVYTSWLE